MADCGSHAHYNKALIAIINLSFGISERLFPDKFHPLLPDIFQAGSIF
jgi:hypothetical protein